MFYMNVDVKSPYEQINNLFGGEFIKGDITQFFGQSGTGVTSIPIKTAIEVAANGGTAAIVLTDFVSYKIESIAQKHDKPTEDILRNIFIHTAIDFEKQSNLVFDELEAIFKLVDCFVFDSFTENYQTERSQLSPHDNPTSSPMGKEKKLEKELQNQCIEILSQARRYDVATILTTDVYIDSETKTMTPIGSNRVSDWCNTIIKCEKDDSWVQDSKERVVTVVDGVNNVDCSQKITM